LLVVDSPTDSGMTIGEEIAALKGPFAGTWRWHSSRDELTIDEGGVEVSAQAAFVPDLGTLREREHVGGGGEREYCGETGIRVNGRLVVTDEQGAMIVDLPILVERKHGPDPEFFAVPFYSPISDFSTRLRENFEYDRSGVAGLVQWLEGGIRAEFTFGAESILTPQSGAGVFFEVAEFE
jgi:hypothetical protein